MAFQGRILTLEDHTKKVVFPFSGQVHEVHLPPSTCLTYEAEETIALELEAAIVLQCLTSRAALELQHALAASGLLPQVPCMEAPFFAAELQGSFADLAQQLQECVQRLREDDVYAVEPATGCTAGLLRVAAEFGHVSAAQQLLLIDPRAGADQESIYSSPVHLAASSAHSAVVLRLMLEAAPDLVWSAVEDEQGFPNRTLMHSAARARNTEAIRLLLQLAPQMANARDHFQHVPLHEAAASGSPNAVRLLLEAAPQTAAAVNVYEELPMHMAAGSGSVDCIRLLLDAGAPGLDVPDRCKRLPLHLAAGRNHEAAVRFLLACHPAAATAEDQRGWRPLHRAVAHIIFNQVAPSAARLLLPVSGLSAQQLLDFLASWPAERRQHVQPLYADIVAHMPLTPEQWQCVPTPCPGLGRALPVVLVHSATAAGLLVAHLPPADRERLRVAALSLHRLVGTLELSPPIPAALLGRMLALSLSDS